MKSAKPADKHYTPDGSGMYLEVAPSGSKIWRMSYRQPNGKRTRLTFGSYPEVSLSDARKMRLDANKMRSAGSDPAQARRDKKQAVETAEHHSFEMVAREWLQKTAATRAESTNGKVTAWLEKDVFPSIGDRPVSAIKPLDVLATVQKMEARGAIDSSHRVKQICGQVLRFAVASGLIERDVTADLKGALSKALRENYAAITEPQQVGALMRGLAEDRRSLEDVRRFSGIVPRPALAALRPRLLSMCPPRREIGASSGGKT